MAYVDYQSSVTVKTPPNVNSEFPRYEMVLTGTIDPSTNQPSITLFLPGRQVTGDLAYWQRIKSAGGIPGLNPEQSALLAETLRTQFSEIVQVDNETASGYRKWLGEDSPAETKPAEPATEAISGSLQSPFKKA